MARHGLSVATHAQILHIFATPHAEIDGLLVAARTERVVVVAPIADGVQVCYKAVGHLFTRDAVSQFGDVVHNGIAGHFVGDEEGTPREVAVVFCLVLG